MDRTSREDREASEHSPPPDATGLLLRAIADATGDVMFAKDREGRFTFANPAALALIGKPLDAVLGRTDLDILQDAEAARRVMANDARIMASGVAGSSAPAMMSVGARRSALLARRSMSRIASQQAA